MILKQFVCTYLKAINSLKNYVPNAPHPWQQQLQCQSKILCLGILFPALLLPGLLYRTPSSLGSVVTPSPLGWRLFRSVELKHRIPTHYFRYHTHTVVLYWAHEQEFNFIITSYLTVAVCIVIGTNLIFVTDRWSELLTLTKQSWKWSLSSGPARLGATDMTFFISSRITSSASGHVFE